MVAQFHTQETASHRQEEERGGVGTSDPPTFLFILLVNPKPCAYGKCHAGRTETSVFLWMKKKKKEECVRSDSGEVSPGPVSRIIKGRVQQSEAPASRPVHSKFPVPP